MMRKRISFLVFVLFVTKSLAGSPCFLAVAGDSISGLPPACQLFTNHDVVPEGSEVKVTLRPFGLVGSSGAEGKKFGPEGGSLEIRINRPQILVGYAEGPLGFSTCFARVTVIQNHDRVRRESFLRISTLGGESTSMEVTVLPEKSVCSLNSSSCLVRVVGGVAALVTTARVTGWKCDGQLIPAQVLGRSAITYLETLSDLSCEPVFDLNSF